VGLLQHVPAGAAAGRSLPAGAFKAVFTFVLPMLLVANVPVRLLVDKLESAGPVLLLLAMSVACFALSELGWRTSIRRYTSASS